MQSQSRKIIWSTFLVVCPLLFASVTFAKNLNMTKAGVVKMTTTTGQTGTGFIVRVEPEVVYIITAAHVIAGDDQPEVEFFTKRNVPIKGAVLPGAELSDDLRGLALVVVRGKANVPEGVMSLSFETSKDLVSGGEEALVIGHSGGGGDWAVLKRNISNRVGRDISMDPGVASRFSGGPIIVDDKVVGIVMSNRDGFGLGITHKSVLNYMEGFGVVPGPIGGRRPDGPIVVMADREEVVMASEVELRAVSESVDPKTDSEIEHDGRPMVLVQSGGFIMGSDPNEVCEWDSIMRVDFCLPERNADYSPPHQVQVQAFYLDPYEVTVEQFGKFVKETGYQSTAEQQGTQKAVIEKSGLFYGSSWQLQEIRKANWRHPMGEGSGTENTSEKFPVVQISWFDAQSYCQWAGKRLPTEAEWEYAARAGTSTKHWWGDVAPTEQVGNIPDIQFRSIFSKSVEFDNLDDGFARAAPVGSFAPNPWGLFDMAGNVWEWTSDWYDLEYYGGSPEKDPSGPPQGKEKVRRGGSWFSYVELKVREKQRPEDSDDQTGFRCAKDAS